LVALLQGKHNEARQLLQAAQQLVQRCQVPGSHPTAFLALDFEW
jgi:hypothetical protein